MTRKRFQALVDRAVADLPEEFRLRRGNLEITSHDQPTAEELASVGLESDELLFGLYEGTPLTERSNTHGMVMPARIIQYQADIEQASASEREIVEEIRKTVIHEVAHFFGIDENEIPPEFQ